MSRPTSQVSGRSTSCQGDSDPRMSMERPP